VEDSGLVEEKEYFEQPIFLYDTHRLVPGAESITFDFSPPVEPQEGYHRLVDLKESELQFFLLGFPHIVTAFFARVEIAYPDCWIGINLPTRLLVGNNWNSKPGDIDFVVGRIRPDSTIDLTYLAAYQIKVCRVDPSDEPKIEAYGTGQTQGTARLGFDRTVLLHLLAQEEKPLPDQYAQSWSGLENVPSPRTFERLLGKVKARINIDAAHWPFGYGILGCGQIEQSNPRLRGAFSPMVFLEAPMRPYSNEDGARAYRKQMEKALRSLWGNRFFASSRPVYLYSVKPGIRPNPFSALPMAVRDRR
jgi:hypothetical protein